MYEGIGSQGFALTEEDFEKQVLFLGQEPRRYEDYASNLVASWKNREFGRGGMVICWTSYLIFGRVNEF